MRKAEIPEMHSDRCPEIVALLAAPAAESYRTKSTSLANEYLRNDAGGLR